MAQADQYDGMQNYEIVKTIGHGSYGTAYLVRDTSNKTLYAMKKIVLSDSNHTDRDAALREARVLHTLKHPNVLGYRESFLHENSLHIVTTFCEEGDLFQRIRAAAKQEEYFSETQILDWFVQIAMALQHIHSKKILHRDLKTQNIFLCKDGVVKIGDFGICKVLEHTNDYANTVTGTPFYMAPECVQSVPYTYKSDLWSLGCVLYEMAMLKHAFDAGNLLSLVYQIVRGTYPPLPPQRYSSNLSNLVHSLLANNPADRPSVTTVLQMPWLQQHMASAQHRWTSSQLAKTIRVERGPGSAPRGGLQIGAQGEVSRRPARGGAVSPDASKALSPQQRLVARKLAQSAQREAELIRASSESIRARQVAKKRFLQEFYRGGSHAVDADNLDDDAVPNMATCRLDCSQRSRSDPTPAAGSELLSNGGFEWGGDAADDDAVMLGTMSPPTDRERTVHDDFEAPRGRGAESSESRRGHGGEAAKSGFDWDEVPCTAAAARKQEASTSARPHSSGDAGHGSKSKHRSREKTERSTLGSTVTAAKGLGLAGAHKAGAPVKQPEGGRRAWSAQAGKRTGREGVDETLDGEGEFEVVYEDDFEEYNPAEEGRSDVVQLIGNLHKQLNGDKKEAECPVSDTFLSKDRAKRVANLEHRCKEKLGEPLFKKVYTYLRKVRHADQASASSEADIQATLQALAGKQQYHDCFLVDQLVFLQA